MQVKSSLSLSTPLQIEVSVAETLQIEMLLQSTVGVRTLAWGPILASAAGLEECPQNTDYLQSFDV